MKNIYKLLCFVLLASVFAGCPKSDDSVIIEPPKPFAEQYPIDEAAINDFLETHFVTVDSQFNTTFTKIETGGTETPIKDMPNLTFKLVDKNDLTYKLYYLVLNEGDAAGESPIEVDSAFVSYKGTLLDNTVFDSAENPVWFEFNSYLISGWKEIIPLFKTGNLTEYPDGTVTYQNFGAGVMFLPSAFAYYNSSIGIIPAYSPLIFNFKLINQKHIDHDRDRVLSVYEYYASDGSILDTDGDGIPNYLDVDDDNDGFLTKVEVKKPSPFLGPSLYYPFNAFTVLDDPLTTEDESLKSEPKGVPDVNGDATTSTRLRRHLDSNAKPPYSTY